MNDGQQPQSGLSRIFAEMKRRRVTRVIVLYAIAGWIVIEVASTVLPNLNLPDWSVTLVTVLVVLGFILAIMLAWAFDIGPGGIHRTPDIPASGDQTAGNQSEKLSADTEQPAADTIDLESIAVLPFVNMSGDAENEYFSDGISEEILNLLVKLPKLRVASRTSSFAFKGKDFDIPEVARRLNVGTVLEGSVRRAGDRVRITGQLIETSTDSHLWSETYDREMVEIFQLQEDVTRTIAATLEENINQAEYNRLLRQPTESLEAYELVNRGRAERLKFTPEGNERALRLSQQALAIDPGYSEAYFSMAWVHINCFRWAWCGERSQDDALAQAFRAARKAVTLDPDSSLAHWVLANATMQSGDLEQAVIEYDRSIALNPNSAGVLADSTEALVYLGRMDEGVARIRAAIRLNPHHPDWYLWTLAWSQYFAGEYEAGLGAMQRMADMPNLARRTQAALLVRLGRIEEARTVIADLLEIAPDYSIEKQGHSLAGKFRDQSAADQFLSDLRTAGLPD